VLVSRVRISKYKNSGVAVPCCAYPRWWQADRCGKYSSRRRSLGVWYPERRERYVLKCLTVSLRKTSVILVFPIWVLLIPLSKQSWEGRPLPIDPRSCLHKAERGQSAQIERMIAHRIVAKKQTQGNSGFVPYSQRAASAD
jgi:hypothetical protein